MICRLLSAASVIGDFLCQCKVFKQSIVGSLFHELFVNGPSDTIDECFLITLLGIYRLGLITVDCCVLSSLFLQYCCILRRFSINDCYCKIAVSTETRWTNHSSYNSTWYSCSILWSCCQRIYKTAFNWNKRFQSKCLIVFRFFSLSVEHTVVMYQ